jgi:hypothetical protein
MPEISSETRRVMAGYVAVAGAGETGVAKARMLGARMLEARMVVNCISKLFEPNGTEVEVERRREVEVCLEAKTEEVLDDEFLL